MVNMHYVFYKNINKYSNIHYDFLKIKIIPVHCNNFSFFFNQFDTEDLVYYIIIIKKFIKAANLLMIIMAAEDYRAAFHRLAAHAGL